MTQSMKPYEVPRPVNIGSLGPQAVVSVANALPQCLIQHLVVNTTHAMLSSTQGFISHRSACENKLDAMRMAMLDVAGEE